MGKKSLEVWPEEQLRNLDDKVETLRIVTLIEAVVILVLVVYVVVNL